MRKASQLLIVGILVLFSQLNEAAPTSVKEIPDSMNKQQSLNSFQRSLDSFIVELMTEFNIKTATSIAVVKGEQILYQQTFGYADIANQIPAGNDTLFYIASITKPLFAFALLQALQQTDYNLNYTLAQMFPEVSFTKEIMADKITIRDLLTHTSGLDDNYLTTAVSISGIHSPEQKLQMLAELFASKNSKLGEFDYTNLGYNILSIWFVRTFKQPWQGYLQQQVFAPLQMQKSTAYMSEAVRQNWCIALPYSFFAEQQEQALYLTKKDNTMHAAGGVLSTSSDMAKWLIAQLSIHNNTASSEQLIAADLLRLSQEQVATLSSKRGDFERQGYALGWYTGIYKNTLSYHHFGSFDGFRPHLSFIPEHGIGLVILNNEGLLNDRLTDVIADFIYSKLLKETNVEQRIAKRITKLKTMAVEYRKKLIQKEQTYRDMPWQLKHDKADYAGIYSHPLAGEIHVSYQKGQFEINWGNLKSVATAYKKPDVMRVNLRPTRPQLLSFDLGGDSESLTLDGIRFVKNYTKMTLRH